MDTLPWLNKPGSRSIFARLMGKAPPAAVERLPQQQYTSTQPFRQQVGQVMAPRTGPAQTTQVDYRRQNGQTVDVSRSGFVPNPTQGDQPVANPFERRFPRPQTITAGSPMAQPLQQQGGLGRLFPRQQTSFRAPTSYNELPPIDPAMRQQARQWSGQQQPADNFGGWMQQLKGYTPQQMEAMNPDDASSPLGKLRSHLGKWDVPPDDNKVAADWINSVGQTNNRQLNSQLRRLKEMANIGAADQPLSVTQPMAPNAQPPESPYGIPPVNYHRAPGAAMAGPSTEPTGLGRLITSRPRNADSVYDAVPTGDRYDTPYYDARRARNATGQGSPYAGMAATQSAQPVAQPAGSTVQMPNLYAMPETEVTGQQPVLRSQLDPARRGLSALMNSGEFAQYTDNGGRKNLMSYSGSGQEQVRRGADGLIDKQMPANSREEILSRTNRDTERLALTPTLQEAADNPYFNEDGRFFQGAGLGVNQNGSAYFRDRPRATDFAGSAQTAQEAGANRLRGLQALEQRGVGYIDPSSGAFFGGEYQRFASDGSTQKGQIAGRLAAGGVTPSSLNQSQLDGNRLAMLTRMAGNREKAMARVQSLAQQSTAARRERMNPDPLKRLMANNPAMAAMQMQANNAQQLQRVENEGRLGVAKAGADAQAAKMPWALAAAAVNNGQPIDQAGRLAGLPQFANAPEAGATPKAKPGAFNGVDEKSFNDLRTFSKLVESDELEAKMREMKVPEEAIPGLMRKFKPPSLFERFQNPGPMGGNLIGPWIKG